MFDAKTDAYLRRTQSTARVAPRPRTAVAAVVAANLSLLMGAALYFLL
nr:hypothetical protein [Paracoccus saliphilus]